jgi:tRNA U34 5-carboxymethylaminomethyl modifying enzyme MnmG/GidA
MTIYALIKTRFEGVHKYPEAAGNESFLKYPHRHIFYVEVKIEQFHDNRDIEYIAFKRWLNTVLDSNLDYKSCEMIANELILKIQTRYPGRAITVQVLEDNENGAVVTA